MSDFRVAVRRTNEWDGPSMLKIYTPYVEKTHYTPDTEVPKLAEYVQRIDTYTSVSYTHLTLPTTERV